MNNEQTEFLKLDRPPARLTAEQAGWYLGFHLHEVGILHAAKLLKPLGRPAPNAPKYFAHIDLERCRTDTKWLSRATEMIHEYWRRKNRRCPDAVDRKPETTATE